MAQLLTSLPADSDAEKSGTIFEQVNGLPTHPLVVHFAVVLLPLSALALLLILIVPRLRRPLGWLVLLGLFVSVGAALVAKETGEAFARLVGNPERHAELGDTLPLLAAALFGLTLIWYAVWWAGDRKRRKAETTAMAGAAPVSAATTSAATATLPGGVSQAELDAVLGTSSQTGGSASNTASGSAAGTTAGTATSSQPGAADGTGGRSIVQLILGVLTGLLALVTIYWTIQTGHSGAEAVWAGRLAPTPAPTAPPTAGPTQSPTASPSGSSAPGTYTLAQVATHNSPADCWSVVNNSVYNLTDWISAHPGGAGPIEGMCGIDATTAFTNQHGGQGQPEAELATFKIGTLG